MNTDYTSMNFTIQHNGATIYGYDSFPSNLGKDKLVDDGACKNTKFFVFPSSDSSHFYQYMVKHMNADAMIIPRKIDKRGECFEQHINTILSFLISSLQNMSSCLHYYKDTFKVHIYSPFSITGLNPVNALQVKKDLLQSNLSRLLLNIKSTSGELVKQYSITLTFGSDNKCTTTLPLKVMHTDLTCTFTNLLVALYTPQIQTPYTQAPSTAWGQNPFNGAPQTPTPVPTWGQPQANPFNAGQPQGNPFNVGQPQANPFNVGQPNAFTGWK